MGILARLLSISVLVGVALSFVLPWGVAVLGGLLVLSLLVSWLSRRFTAIYRMRYLEGRPDEALKMLVPFKLLLPSEQYTMVTCEALAQAGRLDDLKRMSAQESLPRWLRCHISYVVDRKLKDYPSALIAMRNALAGGFPADQRGAFKGEMARFLAEFFPEELPEARRLAEEAMNEVPPGKMKTVMEVVQGIVMVADLEVDPGIEVLRKAAQELGTSDVLTLPVVAEAHRFIGRGLKVLGRTEEAREELLTARTLTRLPSVVEAAQEDLDAL